jgi:DnaJ like chaperone protein
MSWFGKIVGGTIGLALGGPLGAIAGAAFGHFFDKANQVYLEGGGGPTLSPIEGAQMTFFVATFSMLAKLARADGQITRDEIATIENFIRHELRLSAQSRQVAIRIFEAAKDAPDSFEDYARQFHATFHGNPQLLEFMLDILMRVAMADGRLSTEEEQLIHGAARVFGFSEQRFDHLRSRFGGTDDLAYQVLGVGPDARDEEIKHRYRTLVKEYHPDRIAAKGLPEEFTRFAQDKFREIQTAYETIKKERPDL